MRIEQRAKRNVDKLEIRYEMACFSQLTNSLIYQISSLNKTSDHSTNFRYESSPKVEAHE